MNTVLEKIESIVGNMGLGFVYADMKQTDAIVSGNELPVCIYTPPVEGSFSNTTGRFKDSPKCVLFFADQREESMEWSDVEFVVEKCKTYAMKFIEAYNNSALFKPIYGKVTYTPIYSAMGNPLAGLTISFVPEEMGGVLPDDLDEKIWLLDE